MERTEIISLGVAAIGTIATVISTIYTIRTKKENTQLKKQLRVFSWDDIQNGIAFLNNKVWKEFNPDIILAISGPGAIVAYLVSNQYKDFVPVLLTPYHRTKIQPEKDYFFENSFSSSKFTAYLTEDLRNYIGKKILVIDDTVITGHLTTEAKKALVEFGFRKEDIKALCLFTSKTAITSDMSPDYFWMEMTEDEYYLPWGKSFGKSF